MSVVPDRQWEAALGPFHTLRWIETQDLGAYQILSMVTIGSRSLLDYSMVTARGWARPNLIRAGLKRCVARATVVQETWDVSKSPQARC